MSDGYMEVSAKSFVLCVIGEKLDNSMTAKNMHDKLAKRADSRVANKREINRVGFI